MQGQSIFFIIINVTGDENTIFFEMKRILVEKRIIKNFKALIQNYGCCGGENCTI